MFPKRSRKGRTILLRRGIAVLMLWQIAGAVWLLEWGVSSWTQWVAALLGALLVFFLLFGLLLPLTVPLLLLLLTTVIAPQLGFWGLGVEAMAWGLIGLLLTPSLDRFDVDFHWRFRPLLSARVLQRVYRAWERNPSERLFIARFISFMCFALTAAYSVSKHIRDPYWLSGDVGPFLLTSTYMSRLHEVWTSVFDQFVILPALFSFLSFSFILVFGSLWLIVWFRGRLASVLIRISTAAFFVFSAFFLQLGTLPFVEILLWLFWFSSPRENDIRLQSPAWQFTVIYDDRCGLCQRTRKVLGRLDSTKCLLWLPISRADDLLQRIGVSVDQATQDIYAVTADGEVLSGFDFYRRSTWWIPTLWWGGVICKFGQWTTWGYKIYDYVSRRRTRRLENCSLTPQIDLHNASPTLALDDHPSLADGYLKIYTSVASVLLLAYFLTIPAMPWGSSITNLYPAITRASLETVGLGPIDVFNSSDLRMSERWIVLSLDEEGESRILPITNEDGSRGWTQLSDSLYFGSTLPQRRAMIGMTPQEACASIDSYVSSGRVRNAIMRLTAGYGREVTVSAVLKEKPLPAQGGLSIKTEDASTLCSRQVTVQ